MSIHLYCLLPRVARATVPLGLTGVAGARVRPLDVGAMIAWVSDVEPGARVTFDGVKAHDAVIDAALKLGRTPIPARFGQRFDDEAVCLMALQARAESIAALLASVQGYVEMTLIVTPSTLRMLRDLQPAGPETFEQPAAGPGRRYLSAVRAKTAAANEVRVAAASLASQLVQAVASFVRRAAEHEAVTQLPMLTLSHLIERGGTVAYRAAAMEVPTGSELRLLIVGPRAPYSFCALGAEGNGLHGMNLAG